MKNLDGDNRVIKVEFNVTVMSPVWQQNGDNILDRVKDLIRECTNNFKTNDFMSQATYVKPISATVLAHEKYQKDMKIDLDDLDELV